MKNKFLSQLMDMNKRMVCLTLCFAVLLSIFGSLDISAVTSNGYTDTEIVDDEVEVIEDEVIEEVTDSELYYGDDIIYDDVLSYNSGSVVSEDVNMLSYVSTLYTYDGNGNYVEAVVLPVDSKVSVFAYDSMRTPLSYQWQIQIRDGVWADITGEISNSISVNYAMVANILNANGTAVIRCSAVTDEGEFTSNPVDVYIDYTEVVAAEHEYEPVIYITNSPTLSEESSEADSMSRSRAVATADDENTQSNVKISIKYSFEDGTEVHESWLATEALGGAIDQDVIIASVLGYSAEVKSITYGGANVYTNSGTSTPSDILYADNNNNNNNNITISFSNDGQKKINFKSTALSANDIVVDVVYVPSNTSFTIKHYLQNITNDDYSLDKTEIVTMSLIGGENPAPVITGHKVSEYNRVYVVNGQDSYTLSYKYDGFYPLNYDGNVVIAADGSTVVEIYYDRYYYLMDFSLEGGYGVEPIYARFGSYIYDGAELKELPDALTPKRAGYEFLGWKIISPAAGSEVFTDNPADPFHLSTGLINFFNGGYDTFPVSMPAVNMEYKANWAVGTTSFTIEYVMQDPDYPDVYTYFHSIVIDEIDGKPIATESEISLDTLGAAWFGLFEYEQGEEGATGTLATRAKQLGFDSIADMNDAIARDVRRGSYYDSTQTKITNGGVSSVVVEGDGSTLIRVCYSRRVFTLRFIYAATEGEATADYESTYSVVGGSTYFFGANATCNNEYKQDEFKLLTQYFGTRASYSNQVGTIKPANANDKYIIDLSYINEVVYNPDSTNVSSTGIYRLDRKYDSETGYTYRFFEFDARYGASLADLWPSLDVFNDMIRVDANGANQGAAIFAGWNPEYCINYTHYANNTSAQNIKSRYARLDEALMFNVDLFGRSKDATISFLAFWENGSTQAWSTPSLFEYNIMVELTQPDIEKYLDAKNYYENHNNSLDGYKGELTLDDYNAIKEFTPAVSATGQTDMGYYYLYDQYIVVDNDQSGNGEIDDADRNAHPAPSYPNMYIPGGNSNTNYISWVQLTNDQFDKSKYAYGFSITYYYDRSEFNLVLANSNNETAVNKNLPFNYDISKYNRFVPEYPAGAEPGSLVFLGWYTDLNYGEKYTFDVMPMSNLKLFARWASATYQINLYLTHDDYMVDIGNAVTDNDNVTVPITNVLVLTDASGNKVTYSKSIKYGEYLSGLPTASMMAGRISPQLNFTGWYYRCNEHNEEHAFNDQIPITYSMVTFVNGIDTGRIDLYAKWTSTYLETYQVYFIKGNEHGKPVTDAAGNYVNVADPIIGSALGGTTKTFEAKTGTELYESYQTMYYPHVASHSMDIHILTDENPNANTFYFIYRNAAPVTYQVMYLDATTNEPITKDINDKAVEQPAAKSTYDAVVTIPFLPIAGYVPDAYQKRVILVAESVDQTTGEENQDIINIVFYYTRSTTQAPYMETYYIENLDGSFSEYLSYQYIRDIGESYTMNQITIPGFEYVSGYEYETGKFAQATGVLTSDGLHLRMYYKRLSYNYEVQYLVNGTNKPAAATDKGTALYQSTVTQKAITIPGYRLVDSVSEKSINILIESTDTVVNNIIKFYYEPLQVVINYQIVGKDGCGTLDNNHETLSSAWIQNGTAAVDSDIMGCTATANDKYEFLGWHTMNSIGEYVPVETSTVKVETTVNGTKITPLRTLNPTGDTPNNTTTPYLAGNQTYYALFRALETTITITRNDVKSIDTNQSFIYNIKGVDQNNASIDLTVVLNVASGQTSGSVSINQVPVGNYTITEQKDWSWRYGLNSYEATINATADGNNSVVFTTDNGYRMNWLNGNAYSGRNRFGSTN